MVFFGARFSRVVLALIALTLVLSLIAALEGHDGGAVYRALALVPARVWSGELWRLLTWPLVEGDVWALVFGCVSLYWFGGDLVEGWGERRFTGYVVGVVFIAGVGTTLLALVFDGAMRLGYLGGWALGDALTIAWALTFPERRVRIYGVLEIGGPVLAYGTFVVTVLGTFYAGVAFLLPELLAACAALGYANGAAAAVGRRVARRARPDAADDDRP